MAEVVKKKEDATKYKIDLSEKDKVKEKPKKVATKKETKKKTKEEKKSLWSRFRVFCNGVKSETKKVHWTNKEDMIKYSMATIFFIVFCSLFFYLIDVVFALVQSLFA